VSTQISQGSAAHRCHGKFYFIVFRSLSANPKSERSIKIGPHFPKLS